EGRVDVHTAYAMPVVERRVGERRVRSDGGITDEDVDAAELGQSLAHHGFDGAGVGDVGQHRNDLHARLPALGGDRLQLIAVDPSVQHEVCALGREGQRNGAPAVATGPGDERGLALEPHAGRCSRYQASVAAMTSPNAGSL